MSQSHYPGTEEGTTDWLLVRFPHEEGGKQRKISQPWHGTYHMTQRNDPDITVVKVYFSEEGAIQS